MSLSVTIYDEATLRTLIRAFERTKLEQAEYIKSQIILNICEELNLNDLSDQLCDKINCILAFENNSLETTNSREVSAQSVLGITPEILHECNLTSNEQNLLIRGIVKQLSKICSRFKKKYDLLKTGKFNLFRFFVNFIPLSSFIYDL